MTCPHCKAPMEYLDHGVCPSCKKYCGCSFSPTVSTDYCDHHRKQIWERRPSPAKEQTP